MRELRRLRTSEWGTSCQGFLAGVVDKRSAWSLLPFIAFYALTAPGIYKIATPVYLLIGLLRRLLRSLYDGILPPRNMRYKRLGDINEY